MLLHILISFLCVVSASISAITVGFYALSNTCVACPLGTYAISQYGGGVSLALACQVNTHLGLSNIAHMRVLTPPYFSNLFCNSRLVPMAPLPLLRGPHPSSSVSTMCHRPSFLRCLSSPALTFPTISLRWCWCFQSQ